MDRDELDLVIVGGCGHVGLPLALSFAQTGLHVGIFDTDSDKVATVRQGRMPFSERGADTLLPQVLEDGRLDVTDDDAVLSRTSTVVLVVGTPIDEFMNPSFRLFKWVVGELAPRLRDGALVILRSTIYPGTTTFVADELRESGVTADVVFCPERITEGYALEEIWQLPQIVGATSDESIARAAELFGRFGVEIIRTTPEEAELAKLFTNAWRYLKFAVANQFFQLAHFAGIDYTRVLHAVRHDYPRAVDLPGPGFAAGPCLLKDTMQLAAFSPDHFPMGHAAMLVNEGLPAYVIERLDSRKPLRGRTVGILGMAFKGESDDPRTSLSYKLKKLAEFKGATTLCTDPYVADPDLVPIDKVLDASDVVIIAAPHLAYRDLDLSSVEVVDIWDWTGGGIRL